MGAIDCIFTGATIHTMWEDMPRASALALSGDTIVALGDDHQILQLASSGTRHVRLKGLTVIPGINDCHVHLWKEGMLLSQVNARPSQSPTIPALIAAFADRASRSAPGVWIEGRGYDETRLPEGRHPTRFDLDKASHHHPLVLGRTCGHILAVNSRALELAGISRNTPDPPGGEIDRDEHGEPTGVLRETAMALVRAVQPPADAATLETAITAAGKRFLAMGITSIGEPGVDERLVSCYRRLDQEGRLPLRCDVMAMTIDPSGQRLPPPSPFQGRRMRLETCKVFSDGGLSSGTAALSIPYRNRHDCGIPRFPAEQLSAEILSVYQAGLSVAVHAIGDVAIEQVLDAFELCRRTHPDSPARLRIEHFGLPSREQLKRASSLGILIATQPTFLSDLGDTFLHHLPDALIPRCYPFREMLEEGLVTAFSSDGPVVSDVHPMLGLQSAALRRARSGRVLAPEQALDVATSLRCFTVGSAALCGEAHRLGRLAPGHLADLTVLSQDPLTVPVEKLLEIQVVRTYLGGECVFEA